MIESSVNNGFSERGHNWISIADSSVYNTAGKVAFCLLAKDFENSSEDKVLLIEYYNAPAF